MNEDDMRKAARRIAELYPVAGALIVWTFAAILLWGLIIWLI